MKLKSTAKLNGQQNIILDQLKIQKIKHKLRKIYSIVS